VQTAQSQRRLKSPDTIADFTEPLKFRALEVWRIEGVKKEKEGVSPFQKTGCGTMYLHKKKSLSTQHSRLMRIFS
jgi:hypothetical protein